MPKDSHGVHRQTLAYGRTTNCDKCNFRFIKRHPRPIGVKLVSAIPNSEWQLEDAAEVAAEIAAKNAARVERQKARRRATAAMYVEMHKAGMTIAEIARATGATMYMVRGPIYDYRAEQRARASASIN